MASIHENRTNDCNSERDLLAWPTDSKSYEFLSKIGQGAFATVYNAKAKFDEPIEWNNTCNADAGDDNTRLCAIKVLDLEHFDTNLVEIRSEVLTMRLSHHPNVLQFYTSFVHDTQLWLVTQLMSKGSSLCCLHAGRTAGIVPRRSGGLYEPWITFILHQTLKGLDYFHENGQIHRDIKAGNILLDGGGHGHGGMNGHGGGRSGEVRIADFGVSGWLISGGSVREHCKTFVGTPCWMAPEVMEQVTGYDYKADIWSLGITALELAKGYAPYAKFPPMKVLLLTIQQPPPSFDTYEQQCLDNDDYDDYNSINEEQYQRRLPPPPQVWSKTFREVIGLCLQKDAHKRPTCKQLLAHRHFKGMDDPAVLEQKRAQLKSELLDRIPDIGSASAAASHSNRSDGRAVRLPGSTPIYSVLNKESSSSRPAGTSWVFPDGSQVFSNSAESGGGRSSSGGGDNNSTSNDNDDFFDEFERETNGEAYAASKKQHQLEAVTEAAADANSTVGHSNIHTHRDHQTPAPVILPARARQKSDNDDFFDEFERQTSGENYSRK
jgi:serine/threonine-protein kinase OSR1/STK39